MIERTVEYLAETFSLPVFRTRDPGGTTISDAIRAVLLDARNHGIDPMVELLLYLAFRRQLTQEVIEPTLASGTTVICDRYYDSTWVYQGFTKIGTYMGHQDGLVTIRNLNLINETAAAGIQPDLTLWFDVPVEIGLARAHKRAEKLPEGQREDRFEQKKLDFHQKVRDGYGRRYIEEQGRIVRIDARGTLDEVWGLVRSELDRFFSKRGKGDGED